MFLKNCVLSPRQCQVLVFVCKITSIGLLLFALRTHQQCSGLVHQKV